MQPLYRLPLVGNRLRLRSPKCAVPPSKQAPDSRPQHPSPPSNRAHVAHQSRHRSRPDALRSFAHSFHLTQIPITKVAAPPPTIARGFVPWRLSDAGHRVVAPSSMAGIRNPAHERPRAGAAIFVTQTMRSADGISRLSAFAVLRLIASSNFVGISTGISAGFVPLSILSTRPAVRRNRSETFAP